MKDLQTYWLSMTYFILHNWCWIHVCTVFRCECLWVCSTWVCFASLFLAACASCQMVGGCVRHLISYSRLPDKKLCSRVWWKGPLSLAFIRFGQALIKSVWHSSAPLCFVQLCSKAVILEDSSLILAWHRPCALRRQVNCQMKKQLTLIKQIAWVKTK